MSKREIFVAVLALIALFAFWLKVMGWVFLLILFFSIVISFEEAI